jgi:UDP-glucose 4-epimerase
MYVLVTGGSGFIGSHVIELLIKNGHNVVNYDIRPPMFEPEMMEKIKEWSAAGQYLWVSGDIRDKEHFQQFLFVCDGLIHLAGVLGTAETMDSIAETADINVVGTVKVLEALKVMPRKAVYITIGNEWENPYTITKTAAVRFALMLNREFNTRITVCRGLNVYGPRQKCKPVNKFFPRFVINALEGKKIPIFGDGEQQIDVVYVGDVAEVLVKALETEYGPEQYTTILDAGTGGSYTVNETVKMVLDAVFGEGKYDFAEKVEYLPMRKGEPIKSATLSDIAKTTEMLGYVPKTEIRKGFRDAVDWYKEFYKMLNLG